MQKSNYTAQSPFNILRYLNLKHLKFYPKTISVVASNTPDLTEPIAVSDIPEVIVLSAASLPVELLIIFVDLPTNTD